MNREKLLSLAIALGSFGCATASPPPRVEAPPPAAPAEADSGDALEQTVATCQAVQNAQQIPMTCQLGYTGNVATMLLGVPNAQTGAALGEVALKNLIAPFCSSENAASEQAMVVIADKASQTMRTIDCRTGDVSGWQPIDPAAAQLQRAAAACDAVQRSPYRVSCEMADVNGVASLVIGYAPAAISADDLGAIGQIVAAPFCSATNASGVDSAVFFIAQQRNMSATAISCATGAISRWVQNPTPHRQPTGPSEGSSPLPRHHGSYDLMPVASRGGDGH